MSIRSLKKMLSMIACSIRFNWRDCRTRLDAMKEICRLLEERGHAPASEWLQELEDINNEVAITTDGRWMRDVWEGPYPNHLHRKKQPYRMRPTSADFKQGDISDAVWDRFGGCVAE